MSEVKEAFRQLRLRPGLSVMVIFMLAVGIGATTAMFSLFHEMLMQPLPVLQPERLVNLGAPGPKPGSASTSWAGGSEEVFSYPMFRDLEAGQTVFTGIAAHRAFDANLARETRTLAASGVLVSGSYFGVLQIKPAIGRLIEPQDEPRIGESAVVVLSHEYWQNQFGGDPGVVGDTLTVNGQPLAIVGVAPEGFAGTTIGRRPAVFVPLTMRWLMEPTAPREHAEERRAYWLYLFARLRSGVSTEQALVSINALYRGIVNEVEVPLNASFLSAGAEEQFRRKQITLGPGARGQSDMRDGTGRPLALLLAVTALVLLITCLNVANLLLARGAGRAGEMAIRTSIGATRSKLVGQCLAEAGVLAAIGGALSLPVAAATLGALTAMSPEGIDVRFQLNATALAFAAGATLGTVLLFGLVPAFRAARTDVGAVMKGAASRFAGRRGDVRFRAALSTTQIAFSAVLLVLAGLFAQSLANIARIDLGLDMESLVTFTVSPRLNGYSRERAMNLYDELEARLAVEPGVTAVASAAIPLLANNGRGSQLSLEGREHLDGPEAQVSLNEVSVGFLRALGVPLLRGRDLTDADAFGSARVALVNQTLVQQLRLGDNPVGARFGFDGGSANEVEIVGVVADSKYGKVKGDTPAQFFLPRRQNDNLGTLTFYVRGALDNDALLAMIPHAVAEIDPLLPVSYLMTMERQVEDNVYLERLMTMLSAAFATLAMLLAGIGLYGVLAYVVAARTRELGLRLALGAEPADLRAMVLKQVAVMMLIGGTLGLAAALALGRATEALLFGLSGHDPAVLVSAMAILSAVVLAAGYLPARRASHVAPMEALRYE
jgi:putative ABC transport system permease protein